MTFILVTTAGPQMKRSPKTLPCNCTPGFGVQGVEPQVPVAEIKWFPLRRRELRYCLARGTKANKLGFRESAGKEASRRTTISASGLCTPNVEVELIRGCHGVPQAERDSHTVNLKPGADIPRNFFPRDRGWCGEAAPSAPFMLSLELFSLSILFHLSLADARAEGQDDTAFK